ncbi:UDP-N-acetylmuramoyl-tripeptide--D-alanyl-D-alanine ligase, partial [Myxococcota bacterium]|nr:UDP-N-acetylmuramoyl-tripeptide--D-alanyl-D-alanine ligase [Myxococcota bacterium]
MPLSLLRLMEKMEGRLLSGDTGGEVTNFVIDSRRIAPGSLFFALPGETTDGHDYVATALGAGAAAAVVERTTFTAPPMDGTVILVENTVDALAKAGSLAREYLYHIPMVAVTGSCGKTSTKEFLRAALSPLGTVGATPGNLNNHLGVPMTLGSFSANEAVLVVEMGMNHPGEIEFLARMATPQVGVITSICPVHLEGVGSLEGVREAKGELLDHIISGGCAVVPASEPLLVLRAQAHDLKVITFGLNEGTFAVSDPSITLDGSTYTLTTPEGTFTVTCPAGGTHQALNSAAALAAAFSLGTPPELAIEALKSASLPGERSRLEKIGGITLFNDSYNASPSSMEAVLNMVRESWQGPFHLLLGEMRELGVQSPMYHKNLGVLAAGTGASSITYVGNYGNDFQAGVLEAGACCTLVGDAVTAAPLVSAQLSAGDLLVVKGSRGVHL